MSIAEPNWMYNRNQWSAHGNQLAADWDLIAVNSVVYRSQQHPSDCLLHSGRSATQILLKSECTTAPPLAVSEQWSLLECSFVLVLHRVMMQWVGEDAREFMRSAKHACKYNMKFDKALQHRVTHMQLFLIVLVAGGGEVRVLKQPCSLGRIQQIVTPMWVRSNGSSLNMLSYHWI
jgi:hypothetical protein